MTEEAQTLNRAIDAAIAGGEERARLRTLLADIDLPDWFDRVDQSPYGLADWLGALAAFDRWLAERDIATRPAESMLGYLECCTLALPRTLPLPPFAELARENLDRYGFDATRPASSEPDPDFDGGA